tara:strand:+ start:1078 stop:2004 length:927 start_codon:yes stop_codon:yes gene_type:complete
MLAFVFPGQGSQIKGMGRTLINEYPNHIKILDEISEISSINIKQLCFDYSDSNINESIHSALAVFSISSLIFEILKENSVVPNAYAGYSLGYYSALYASGYISLPTACYLVKLRAKLLKKSAKNNPSGMIGIIGLKKNQISQAIKGIDHVYIANENSPVNFTISYDLRVKPLLDRALDLASPLKVVDIPVEGGWHSPFMQDAAELFSEHIINVNFNDTNKIVVDNSTARPIENIIDLPQLLIEHIYKKVKWRDTIDYLIKYGCTDFIEVGYGDQLSKFILFTNRQVNVNKTGEILYLKNVIEKYSAYE